MGIPLDPKEPNLIQRNSQDLQTAHDGPRVQSWDAFPLAARAGRIFFGKASKRAIGGGGEDGRTIAAALPWPPYGGVGAGEASLSSGARDPSDSLSPQWSLLRRLLQ